MGRRHPDQAHPPPQPWQGLTLGQIKARGWSMRAVCGRCDTRLEVDVAVLIRLMGSDADLWGRHPRCRAYPWDLPDRCKGRVTFELRATNLGTPTRMIVDGTVTLVREMMAELARQRAEAEGPPRPPKSPPTLTVIHSRPLDDDPD